MCILEIRSRGILLVSSLFEGLWLLIESFRARRVLYQSIGEWAGNPISTRRVVGSKVPYIRRVGQ